MMEAKDPIARLREIAATLDDAAASMSEHGFSIPGIKAKSIADEIEAQYMRLPVDADGVPIRIGDEMEWTNSHNGEKERFVCAGYTTEYSTWMPDNLALMATNEEGAEFYCVQCHHVKPDTVEAELAKFLTACGDDDPHYYDEQIAEFAERIRKAVEHGNG